MLLILPKTNKNNDNKNRYNKYLILIRLVIWYLMTQTPIYTLNDNTHKSKSNFVSDNSIHLFFRAANGDFKNSGYDRGHLAAAANHRHSQKAMDQTFILSNISPQVLYKGI
jgi:endonuclease G